MNCPHCGHAKSRVLETRGDRRVRQCGKCLKDFSTYECLAAFAGKKAGWIHEAPPMEEAPVEPNFLGITKGSKEWYPVTPDLVADLDAELGELLIAWWNESRRKKNKERAVWTERAWNSNLKRVKGLPLKKGLALARRGVESGWQSLQEKWLEGETIADDGTVTPTNPAMRAALEAWN